MSSFKYIERLERIFQMIKQGKTGNSLEFASRFGISRRLLFTSLDELCDIGIPIIYDRKNNSFILQRKCIFKLEINLKIFEDNEINAYS